METWYRVSLWSTQPYYTPVEIERYSDKCVWLDNGRRQARNANYEKFFATEQEAQAACTEHLQTHLRSAENSKVVLERKLILVQEMLTRDPSTFFRS